MTDDLTTVRVDEFLPHAPARVWAALTDADALRAWFMDSDFKPVVGHRFEFRTDPIAATNFSGVIACEVLDLQPEALLRYSWVDARNPDGLDSIVTWTRLEVPHPPPPGRPPERELAMNALELAAQRRGGDHQHGRELPDLRAGRDHRFPVR